MPTSADHRTIDRSSRRTGACPSPACPSPWMPWLAAPLFLFLPVLGCWLTGPWHEPRSTPPRQQLLTKQVTPVITMVTVATPR